MRFYSELKKMADRGKKAALVTVLDCETERKLVGKKILVGQNEIIGDNISVDLKATLKPFLDEEIERGRNTIMEINTMQAGRLTLFLQLFSPQPRLIILGGGHVGAALCRIAANLDFEIILIDDRPSFAGRSAHPHAHLLICDQFETALDQIKPSGNDYMVIVTRGHRHDQICLEKALSREAAYIGMIGSKKRVLAQMEDLAGKGYPREDLARVHAPIGLSIGAVSEAEIAISILAEIIQVRRKDREAEALQKEVLEELVRLEENNERAVVATIVRTGGSTPRKSGSQMIVFPDGQIKGTIGGGCAEAEVRREALFCLDHNHPELLKFNLTADAAADEGMACGGVMQIFLEPMPHITPEI